MEKELVPEFALDELLAELAGPEKRLEGYRTRAEWCEMLGVTDNTMYRILHLARDQGKLLVAKENRKTIAGYSFPTPVYAFDLKKRGEQ